MIKTHHIVFGLVLTYCSFTSANEKSLDFEAGYIVDGISKLQPSGLTECEGRLVFVSDKHESEVFELALTKKGIAQAKVWKTIDNIPNPPEQKFGWWMEGKRFLAEVLGLTGGADWEGVACDDQGNLFLASEYYFSLLKVDLTGNKEWLVEDLYSKGREFGLFEKDNAYIEGVMIGENGILLADEREPRGFVSIKNDIMSFYAQPGTHLSEENLPYDYTGLDEYKGEIIALERNHYKVCKLSKDFKGNTCYSFRDVANSSNWGYVTGRYGLAEGLAVTDDFLWIIFDNNGDYRKANPEDSRSTLLKFKNPF
ncbi:hypothetical protein [Microbulbifer epialgicus]|uniref:Esterase-like activity of phytase n=1 Tax=Microbulbifer epialgicus TaxID=393907 RepID=A0ABV4NUD1_9GAMM